MSIAALHWARSQTVGNAGRKAVLMSLADRADEAWSCFPGQELIAAETEQGVRTVRRHLLDLETAGFIRRVPRRRADGLRTSDRYELRPDLQPANLAGGSRPATFAARPAIDGPSTGQPRQGHRPTTTGSPANLAREPKENHQKNHQQQVQAHASASRDEMSAGEIRNVKPRRETVDQRARRLVGDVLGKATRDVAAAADDDVVLAGLLCETLVPCLVGRMSDRDARAALRQAHDEGDVTDAWKYLDVPLRDWRDGA